jgi:RNA polymerase sigma factor (sigma-70 family)
VTEPAPPDSFDAFYEETAIEAVRLATLLTSNAEDAQDLVQEAFVGLLRRWGSLENPAAYLQRSITNGAANAYRRRSSASSRQQRLQAQHQATVPGTDEYLADQIAVLPHAQRAVIVLKYYLQLPDREIAELTGMRPGSVGPTLGRALRRLREDVDHGA